MAVENAIALMPPRLPWQPEIEARFGVTKSTWRALIDGVWPSAKTLDGVILALSYCRARNLDPLKKTVHIVPMYSSVLKRDIETVWPGIAEVRTTAARTGQYAGIDATEFGPDMTKTFANKDKDGKMESITITFPAWAQSTVYRTQGGERRAFVGPRVYWLETYSPVSRWTDAPNARWIRSPYGQLEKCAEAGGLRRAFPEEIGADYTAEEMEGKTIDSDGASHLTKEEQATATGFQGALQKAKRVSTVKALPPAEPITFAPEPELEREPEPVPTSDEQPEQSAEVEAPMGREPGEDDEPEDVGALFGYPRQKPETSDRAPKGGRGRR